MTESPVYQRTTIFFCCWGSNTSCDHWHLECHSFISLIVCFYESIFLRYLKKNEYHQKIHHFWKAIKPWLWDGTSWALNPPTFLFVQVLLHSYKIIFPIFTGFLRIIKDEERLTKHHVFSISFIAFVCSLLTGCTKYSFISHVICIANGLFLKYLIIGLLFTVLFLCNWWV